MPQIFVALRGRFDANAVLDLETASKDICFQQNLEVHFDLTDLNYVSSAGIAFFIRISKELSRHNSSLSFSGLRGEVQKVFDISGLSLLFKIDQAVDITAEQTERKPLTAASQRERLSLPAKLGSLDFFRDFLSNYIRRSKLSSLIIPTAELVLEEIFVNIVKYGYGDSRGDIELICSNKNGALCLEFWDQGPHFNPLDHNVLNLNAPLEERKVGGLGIHLVKEMAEEIEYRREGSSNILKVYLRAQETAQATTKSNT